MQIFGSLVRVALLLVAPWLLPALTAGPVQFELPARQTTRSLFAATPDAVRQPARLAAGASRGNWPWRGIEVSSHTSLYPVWLAVGQSVDVAIPVTRWLSPMVRVEGMTGLIFTGGIFDLGVRGRIETSDRFGVFFEGFGRFGIGELTIAEIFENAFKDHVDAQIDAVHGFGLGTAAGIEWGGPRTRFTLGAHLSWLFLNGEARAGSNSGHLENVTMTTFGFTFGIRFFFG